jgi:rSAM/selenodomain-associated transferase 1
MKPHLSDEECAELQHAMIQDTVEMVHSLSYPLFIAFTPQETSQYYNLLKVTECFPQAEGDLGQRMSAGIFYILKKGFSKVLLIGTDSPRLQPSVLVQADQSLAESDLCVGPSEDGGYYLIGMKEFRQELFEGIEWSTQKVFEQTLNAAGQIGFKTTVLHLGYDLDCWDDFVKLDHALKNSVWEKRPEHVEKFYKSRVCRKVRK